MADGDLSEPRPKNSTTLLGNIFLNRMGLSSKTVFSLLLLKSRPLKIATKRTVSCRDSFAMEGRQKRRNFFDEKKQLKRNCVLLQCMMRPF